VKSTLSLNALYRCTAATIQRRFDSVTSKGLYSPETRRMSTEQQRIGAPRRYLSRLTAHARRDHGGGRGSDSSNSRRPLQAAAPFGGKFRIIDFVLSNCLNSASGRSRADTVQGPLPDPAHRQGWDSCAASSASSSRPFLRSSAVPRVVPGHRGRAVAEHGPDPRAPAAARARARRRSHLQDGLRPMIGFHVEKKRTSPSASSKCRSTVRANSAAGDR